MFDDDKHHRSMENHDDKFQERCQEISDKFQELCKLPDFFSKCVKFLSESGNLQST